jgi:hypothetical protein
LALARARRSGRRARPQATRFQAEAFHAHQQVHLPTHGASPPARPPAQRPGGCRSALQQAVSCVRRAQCVAGLVSIRAMHHRTNAHPPAAGVTSPGFLQRCQGSVGLPRTQAGCSSCSLGSKPKVLPVPPSSTVTRSVHAQSRLTRPARRHPEASRIGPPRPAARSTPRRAGPRRRAERPPRSCPAPTRPSRAHPPLARAHAPDHHRQIASDIPVCVPYKARRGEWPHVSCRAATAQQCRVHLCAAHPCTALGALCLPRVGPLSPALIAPPRPNNTRR